MRNSIMRAAFFFGGAPLGFVLGSIISAILIPSPAQPPAAQKKAEEPKPVGAVKVEEVASVKGSNKGYTLDYSKEAGGLWVHRDGKGPMATLYSQDLYGGAAALGFYRSQEKAGDGCDFAIAVNGSEVYFQIRDDKGKFQFVPATALLKLRDK